MEFVMIQKCEDGAIWITSDEDMIGIEATFSNTVNENEKMLIALAKFLGYDPAKVLNLESISNKGDD